MLKITKHRLEKDKRTLVPCTGDSDTVGVKVILGIPYVFILDKVGVEKRLLKTFDVMKCDKEYYGDIYGMCYIGNMQFGNFDNDVYHVFEIIHQ